jgi:hypothetical protein
MFNLAIDSKLRGCDVVAIRVEDVAAGGYTADHATVLQKKTRRPVRFELSERTRQAIDDYVKAANKRPGEFLFTGRRGVNASMTTRQYARLVSEWIGSVGLDPRLFGTHSLRPTKATLIYRAQAISGPSSSCSGTPRSKAQSGISALRSMTPWQSRNRSTSDALGRSGRADTLWPSLYHRVTSHVPSGGNQSAILTGNHTGNFSSGCQARE